MTATELAARLDAKRNGDGWQAKCPAHEDTTPSLSISEGMDGRVLLHCHAGCAVDEILGALAMQKRDLFADNGTSGREIVATYDYVDETGALLSQIVRFFPKDFRQRRPDGLGGWTWNLNGTRRVLYRLPQLRAAVAAGERVFVVEGEKDVAAIERAGYVATCNSGGAGKWRREYSEELKGADVVIVADTDAPGRTHAGQVARALQGVASKVVVVEPAVGKDVSDHLAAGRKLGELVPVTLEEPAKAEPAGSVIVRLHDVTPARVRWVWRGWIPRAKQSLLDGEPDLGKSTLLLDVAARLSTGRPLPDGQPSERSGVVILSAEDDTADTIVPRLLAAGADLTRIVQLKGIRLDDYERPPVFPADLPALAEAVRAVNAVWVIIDPLVAYFGDETDTWKDQSVRRALYHLARFAEETGVALTGQRHFTKTPSAKALHRGGGSIGLIGAARAAFLVAPDPDNPERRILAVSKANLTRKPPSLMYEIESVGEVGRIKWLGESAHRADQLVAEPAGEEERQEAQDLKAFIREMVEAAPRTQREALAAIRAAGFDASERSVRRARKAAGVTVTRQGFGPGSVVVWALDGIIVAKNPIPDTPTSVATMASMASMSHPRVDGRDRQNGSRTCPQGHSMHHIGSDPATGWICLTCYPAALSPPDEAAA